MDQTIIISALTIHESWSVSRHGGTVIWVASISVALWGWQRGWGCRYSENRLKLRSLTPLMGIMQLMKLWWYVIHCSLLALEILTFYHDQNHHTWGNIWLTTKENMIVHVHSYCFRFRHKYDNPTRISLLPLSSLASFLLFGSNLATRCRQRKIPEAS